MPDHARVVQAAPSLPGCSADWRFLLPITNNSRVLIITHGCDEFALSLGGDVKAITWRSNISAYRNRESSVKNGNVLFADYLFPPFPPSSFDIIALPLGIPSGISKMGNRQFHQNIRRLLRPGGSMLFGFANPWGIRRSSDSEHTYSTINNMLGLLRGIANYSSVEIYGVFPNLAMPEFIFLPRPENLRFILQRRYKYKIPNPLLNLFSSLVFTSVLSKFLPFYFAVASAETQ